MTREQLAQAHHHWHCGAPIPDICAADDSDYDFADFALQSVAEVDS